MSGYSSQEINNNHLINQFPNILVEQAKRRLEEESEQNRARVRALEGRLRQTGRRDDQHWVVQMHKIVKF